MSKDIQCLQVQTGKQPSKAVRCTYCSSGPCKFVAPPASRRRKDKRTRKRYPQKGKPYPRMRTRLLQYGTSELPFRPAYWYGTIFGDTSYDESGPFYLDGGTVDIEGILEVSRLPKSRGCQVIHEHFYVSPVMLEPGPTKVLKAVYPSTGDIAYAKVQDGYPIPGLISGLGKAWLSGGVPIVDFMQAPFLRELRSSIEPYAFNAMRPAFKTGFSLFNFILELDDLKSLIHLPSYAADQLRAAFLNATSLKALTKVSGWRSKSWNKLADLAAELHLGWNFAVAPLIGDLHRICATLGNFNREVEIFRRGMDEINKRRYFQARIEVIDAWKESLRRQCVIEFPNGFSVTYDCVVVDLFSQSDGTPTGHGSYHATMDFTYTCKTLADMDPYVAALYQKIGLKPDATILWNAIPFSFVLDWFVDVQGFLKRYASLELIESEVNIQLWQSSFRMRPLWSCTPVSVAWRSGAYETTSTIHDLEPIEVKAELYTRFVSEPDVEQLVQANRKTPDGLTLKRGYLSASLLKKVFF